MHRHALRRFRQVRGAWYHGTDDPNGAFQRDGEHPGIWAANCLQSALWYAHHPVRPGVVYTLTLPDLPSLVCAATLRELSVAAGLSVKAVRRAHQAGTLYLSDQERLCEAARAAGYAGLVMRDFTERAHLSAVLWTARPQVTGGFALEVDGTVTRLGSCSAAGGMYDQTTRNRVAAAGHPDEPGRART